ncbi:heavy-metal-associated domain-containing protein [Maribacter huludaoensis]|uniref:heavy-metal-associated domain-containing protein n=1 Tax=Maribacter huludaoensis TaxID=3030010 RepID=UPI0023EE0572|nr:heavy metal-associated domain-containing protein [Maribacter huludaoensis]MDF4222683.1 heavy metal-associated domain-containing protein [Maribacter huludaoensis]
MTSIIPIQNLKCGGCAKTIVSKLEEISTVTNVSVNVETSSVSFDAVNQEDINIVKTKLKAIGYPSIDEENSVLSKAKSFVSCATGKLSN